MLIIDLVEQVKLSGVAGCIDHRYTGFSGSNHIKINKETDVAQLSKRMFCKIF
ncbi:hypothetical protein D3C86_2000230 [compost metagenome]